MNDDWIAGTFFGIIAILCLAFAFAIYYDNKRSNLLMAQCMADGHKEYECAFMEAKTHNTYTTTPVPIIIH